MTLPRDSIVFNTGTGSDTAASGLGPTTAVTGTAAAHTGGSASTTITLTNSPDLSGVVAGDLLFLANSGSTRRFSVIASADNGAKTVTVDDSFNIAAGSPVDYAIGGKRNTWGDSHSQRLFNADAKSGWEIVTETDQTFSIAGGLNCNITASSFGSPIVIRGDSTSTLRTISQSSSSQTVLQCPGNVGWTIKNLKIQNTGASHGGTGINGFGRVTIENCVVGDSTNTLSTGIAPGSMFTISNTEVGWCTSTGISAIAGEGEIDNCYVHDCGSGGILTNSSTTLVSITKTVVANNTGVGITDSGNAGNLTIDNCTIDNNTSDGIKFTGSRGGLGMVRIDSNQITRNGGYGINSTNSYTTGTNGAGAAGVRVDYNNIWSNTSGQSNNVTLGSNNTNTDPGYTNTSGKDWSIGTATKAGGFPPATQNLGSAGSSGATKTYLDPGAAQRQEPVTSGRRFLLIKGTP